MVNIEIERWIAKDFYFEFYDLINCFGENFNESFLNFPAWILKIEDFDQKLIFIRKNSFQIGRHFWTAPKALYVGIKKTLTMERNE